MGRGTGMNMSMSMGMIHDTGDFVEGTGASQTGTGKESSLFVGPTAQLCDIMEHTTLDACRPDKR